MERFALICFALGKRRFFEICTEPLGLMKPRQGVAGRYPSGQRGQTVNLLAYVFQGSNPCLPTIQSLLDPEPIGLFLAMGEGLRVYFWTRSLRWADVVGKHLRRLLI